LQAADWVQQMAVYKTFDNGFEYIDIVNKSGRAKIAVQGAHLFHCERVGEQPLLWVSETSFFEPGKAIRGGVPICWPWFGKHQTDSSLPQHGFVRTSVWTVVDIQETDEHTTELILQLKSSARSLQLWPYIFELQLHVTVAEKLTIALTTKNCDENTFTITSALHSYFTVSDIDNVYIEGLDKTRYFDSLTKESIIQKGNTHIGGEVDRIYQNVRYPLTIHDQKRNVHIDAHGSSSAVIWNPWKEKCARMGDMKDDAYTTMLCIETANALDDARTLLPGDKHTVTAILS